MNSSILWFMISSQMFAWLYAMHKGEKITDKGYILFTIGMMMGQLGGGIDCFFSKAWPTFSVQVFFFIVTFYGCLRRLKVL